MSGLQRRAAPGRPEAAAVDGMLPIHDEQWVKKFPTLAEFISRVLWEPGQPREKGSVFLFFEDGVFKACLNDKDSSQVAFTSSLTFAGLWEALEKGLAKNTLDWRLSTQGKAKRGK